MHSLSLVGVTVNDPFVLRTREFLFQTRKFPPTEIRTKLALGLGEDGF